MYVCMYVCMCVYVYMHLCMYDCMNVCMHVCMYVCLFVIFSVSISFHPSFRFPSFSDFYSSCPMSSHVVYLSDQNQVPPYFDIYLCIISILHTYTKYYFVI